MNNLRGLDFTKLIGACPRHDSIFGGSAFGYDKVRPRGVFLAALNFHG